MGSTTFFLGDPPSFWEEQKLSSFTYKYEEIKPGIKPGEMSLWSVHKTNKRRWSVTTDTHILHCDICQTTLVWLTLPASNLLSPCRMVTLPPMKCLFYLLPQILTSLKILKRSPCVLFSRFTKYQIFLPGLEIQKGATDFRQYLPGYYRHNIVGYSQNFNYDNCNNDPAKPVYASYTFNITGMFTSIEIF